MRSAVCLQQSICEKIHSSACVLSRTDTALICRFTDLAQVCACVDIHTDTHARAGTVCAVWQTATSLYLPSDVPCVPPRLPLQPFFLFSSINTSLQFPPPLSLPAATNHRKPERTGGDIKKRENQKMVRGGGISGGLSFFPSNKRPVGIHLRPICWHRATE